jgi:elongation factor Ts
MDCKKALTETGGDLEQAVDWLRKKGLSAAAKKSGRIAAEGLVAVASEGNKAAIVEVNAETDFVARNAQFQAYAGTVAKLALNSGDSVEALQAVKYPDSGRNVQEELTHMVATIGENMSLRRLKQLSVPQGVVASYVHNAVAPNAGKIGVLVALESAGDAAKLNALGKQIAMHVAATNPQSVSTADLDPASVARERTVLEDQAKTSGRPPEVIAKMVEGRLRKFYEEVVLSEQVFVVDGETKVGKVVENAAKDIGAPVKLVGFVRFALGEGIEKKSEDFAAEVAAQLRA